MKIQSEENLSGWRFGFMIGDNRVGMSMIYLFKKLITIIPKKSWDGMQKDRENMAAYEKTHKMTSCEACKGRGYFVQEVKQ